MTEHDHLARLEQSLTDDGWGCPSPEEKDAIAWAVKTIREVGEQLEHDRSVVADCMTKAVKAIDSRHWLTEGRGPYEWNDDKWHEEFYAAATEIRKELEPLAKVAADWKGCPQSSAEIAEARIDLKKTIRQQEARIADLQADHQMKDEAVEELNKRWRATVAEQAEEVKRLREALGAIANGAISPAIDFARAVLAGKGDVK